jgi:spore germination cell wall hydrolase CwlJ-like protein
MSYLSKVFKALATLALLTVTPLAMAQTTSRHDQAQLECLAQNIYYEARGESLKGQVAVANVVMNRIAYGFAKTPCGVINQRNQFSWVRHHPKITNIDLYERVKQIARTVYFAKVVDITHGALYYHAKYVNPHWPYARVTTIGNHIFYKIA